MSKKEIVEWKSGQVNPNLDNVVDVEPDEVREKQSQVHLIDVRRPEEYTGELGHVPGAGLIVLDVLPEKISELPKDETIVFICRSGGRSANATALAKEYGFRHVYNMRGGMLLWNEKGYEIDQSEPSQ